MLGIGIGSKTSTGGVVIEGNDGVLFDGLIASSIGHKATCPACKKGVGEIVAVGERTIYLPAGPAARAGDYVACGCPPGSNTLLAQGTVSIGSQHAGSMLPASTSLFSAPRPPADRLHADLKDNPQQAQLAESQKTWTNPDTAESVLGHSMAEEQEDTLASVIEPGFHIVQEAMSRSALEELLFDTPSPELLAHFRHLNPHLGERLKPGQMAIISDPASRQCSREEAQLMEAAAQVEAALQELSEDEAQFMVEHYDSIGSFLGYSGAGLSVGSLLAGRHLDSINLTLTHLEQLHQSSYARYGHLRHESFFTQRRELMRQLDGSLRPLVRKGTGIPDHPKLKHALGISSRSLVHHWNQAGVPGEIPGYASHIEGVSRASRYIKLGGWVGLGLTVASSELAIQEACRVGREEECRQVKFTERGSFAGGVAGGAAAGYFVSSAKAGAVCAAIGLGSGGVGTVACALVVVGGASVVAGAVGGMGGEIIAEKIYEATE